jgi:sarcosine oxidase subunit gamma
MTTFTRRSPAHDALEHLKPRWGRLKDMPVALDYGDPRAESERAKGLGLCDVSAFPRITVKGPGASRWLGEQGLEIPAGIYSVGRAGRTDRIIRTGGAEFLIEDGVDGQTALRLISTQKEGVPGVYRIPRQDASYLLMGKDANLVLLETCGVDCSGREERAVFSRVAGVSCALLAVEIHKLPAFQIWCDPSYGAYLWETLLEIVRDKGGGPVGMSSVFPELES